MKTCSKCKSEKPETDFYFRSGTKKRQTVCKKCVSIRGKSYYTENREGLIAQQKAYQKENREKIAARHKIYCAENREELAAKNKLYYAENRDERAAQQKIYRKENREKIAAQRKVFQKENRERLAVQKRASQYGVTPDDFKRILVEQGGVCAICGGLGGKRGLCVDHDHESNKVRGLLCQTCNSAIGLLKDCSAVARLAASYLKKHGK